jgi:hypothetical protein
MEGGAILGIKQASIQCAIIDIGHCTDVGAPGYPRLSKPGAVSSILSVVVRQKSITSQLSPASPRERRAIESPPTIALFISQGEMLQLQLSICPHRLCMPSPSPPSSHHHMTICLASSLSPPPTGERNRGLAIPPFPPVRLLRCTGGRPLLTRRRSNRGARRIGLGVLCAETLRHRDWPAHRRPLLLGLAPTTSSLRSSARGPSQMLPSPGSMEALRRARARRAPGVLGGLPRVDEHESAHPRAPCSLVQPPADRPSIACMLHVSVLPQRLVIPPATHRR